MFCLISQMEFGGGIFVIMGGIVAFPAYLVTFLASHMIFASLTGSNDPTPAVRRTVHLLLITVSTSIIIFAFCLTGDN